MDILHIHERKKDDRRNKHRAIKIRIGIPIAIDSIAFPAFVFSYFFFVARTPTVAWNAHATRPNLKFCKVTEMRRINAWFVPFQSRRRRRINSSVVALCSTRSYR